MANIKYITHVENSGWENSWKEDGQISGTTGLHQQIESIMVEPLIEGVQIEYQLYVENHGWMPPVQSPHAAGTTGENRAIEAIRFKILGDAANQWDLWYRVHIENYGFLDWVNAPDGIAGSMEGNKQVEAIQIYLVPKNSMYLASDSADNFLSFERPKPPAPAPAPQPSNAERRLSVIRIAGNEVGYRADWNNNSKYASYWGDPGGEYCHYFVCWCYDKAGLINFIPKTGYCPTGMNWFINHPTARFMSRQSGYRPDAGDLIYFDWYPQNGVPNHVGLVEAYEDGLVHTIEANTGGTPSGVVRKVWGVNDANILGYGVPSFA